MVHYTVGRKSTGLLEMSLAALTGFLAQPCSNRKSHTESRSPDYREPDGKRARPRAATRRSLSVMDRPLVSFPIPVLRYRSTPRWP